MLKKQTIFYVEIYKSLTNRLKFITFWYFLYPHYQKLVIYSMKVWPFQIHQIWIADIFLLMSGEH